MVTVPPGSRAEIVSGTCPGSAPRAARTLSRNSATPLAAMDSFVAGLMISTPRPHVAVTAAATGAGYGLRIRTRTSLGGLWRDTASGPCDVNDGSGPTVAMSPL